jgi:hypothetical protein
LETVRDAKRRERRLRCTAAIILVN